MKKRKKMLQIVSLLLCATFITATPVRIKAEELPDKEPVYYDTEQGRVVNDIDEYISQLNAGVITPSALTITNHETGATPFDLSEPSKKCSNIFGHKWGKWVGWMEINRIHYPYSSSGQCLVIMENIRYCTRTYCGAHQTERDYVWVTCIH